MSRPAPVGINVEQALGSALLDLLSVLRGGARLRNDGDGLADPLARHALIESIGGCAVCLIEGGAVRVAGVAGDTGEVAAGSVWKLAGSPVAQVLVGNARILTTKPARSQLGKALAMADGEELLVAPLRLVEGEEEEATLLGALLLVHYPATPLSGEAVAFFEDYASLVALAMLGAGPGQGPAGRARRFRGNVDLAVDLVGSLDAGQVIPRVLQRTCQALDVSRATLLRLDADEIVVEGVHDVDLRPVMLDWRGPISEQPLLLAAMRSGQVVIGDNVAHERFPTALRDAFSDVRHTMILPLRMHENVTGFMIVFRRSSRAFTHDDAVTIQLLGNVALLALRNARLYADAQAASQAMSSFLNLVVHDLRAPLTVLTGYVDLLRDGTFGDGPDAWQKPFRMMASKLRETHRLVDDLLLAARLDSGNVPTTLETLDLNELILQAAVRSEARAGLAGARIETAPRPEPVMVLADGFHVDRIVDNLVNNAISYGGSSPWVRLSVDASRPPAIRVEDRGVGISPELHARIFDRFFRIDDHVPGTGFGLHVGRVLAEACRGSLRLERSVLGEGSLFRLELPAASSADLTRSTRSGTTA